MIGNGEGQVAGGVAHVKVDPLIEQTRQFGYVAAWCNRGHKDHPDAALGVGDRQGKG